MKIVRHFIMYFVKRIISSNEIFDDLREHDVTTRDTSKQTAKRKAVLCNGSFD